MAGPTQTRYQESMHPLKSKCGEVDTTSMSKVGPSSQLSNEASAPQDSVCVLAPNDNGHYQPSDVAYGADSVVRNKPAPAMIGALATWAAGICLLAAGCSSVETFSLKDEGDFCIVNDSDLDSNAVDAEVLDFEPDQPATVGVVLLGNAGGCAKDVEASCEVTVEGNDLVVHAKGSYSLDSEKVACPDVWVPVAAQCRTPALPAGVHSFRYGTKNLQLDVPSQQQALESADGVCESVTSRPR